MLNKQIAKLIAVIIQNLPEMSSEMMQRHIENPKGVQEILRAFLVFPSMTVKLGTGLKSADDFLHAFKKVGVAFGTFAGRFLYDTSFRVADQLTEVSIAVLTVAELGFESKATYADICQRGVTLGYGLCPSELGPQLRLQYKNQPKGEVLLLAMQDIRNADYDFGVFYVGNAHALFISGNYIAPSNSFDLSERIVFVRRK